MATDKQKLARARNWLKFRVMGMHVPIGPFTNEEKLKVQKIQTEIAELQKMFNQGSRELGLNVRTRCWCGKPIADNCADFRGKLSCKEHHEN